MMPEDAWEKPEQGVKNRNRWHSNQWRSVGKERFTGSGNEPLSELGHEYVEPSAWCSGTTGRAQKLFTLFTCLTIQAVVPIWLIRIGSVKK